MAENGLRRDNRNDPVARAVASHPGVAAAIDARKSTHEEMQQKVSDAIQDTQARKLTAWVAVAVWENEDGTMSHEVVGDDHSSFLELKGYLHDGVWAAAHTEH